jgi:hypothetical protein
MLLRHLPRQNVEAKAPDVLRRKKRLSASAASAGAEKSRDHEIPALAKAYDKKS